MDTLDLRGALLRLASPLLGAGVFYLAWMAAFLVLTRSVSVVAETVLWLLAPVMTAAGFAVGITVAERLAKKDKSSFMRIYVWPLVGCVIGAAIVYPFGPMLIVFGMFAGGTSSVAVREIVGRSRSDWLL